MGKRLSLQQHFAKTVDNNVKKKITQWRRLQYSPFCEYCEWTETMETKEMKEEAEATQTNSFRSGEKNMKIDIDIKGDPQG